MKKQITIDSAKKQIDELKKKIELAQTERFEITKQIQKLNQKYRELGAISSISEDEIDRLEIFIRNQSAPSSNKNEEDL